MSAKINRDDWTGISLFGPKTTNGMPSKEGDLEEDYEVDEEYIEGETMATEEMEDVEEDDATARKENRLVNYEDDDDED